jgi:outer membrane protein assembly factor BamB
VRTGVPSVVSCSHSEKHAPGDGALHGVVNRGVALYEGKVIAPVLDGRLRALDIQTGKLVWKEEFYSGHPPGGRHRKNSFASETPVTDGKLVYVYIGNLGLYAYDLKGTQMWHTPVDAYPIYLDFGTGGSAALWGNKLVLVNDNEKQQFIAAFDKNTGKQIWRTNRDVSAKGDGPPTRSGWVTPFVWETPARSEIVTVGPGIAVSYDGDGKELWRLSGMSATPIPSPFAYQSLLYLNGGRGKSVFAIKPGATGDLTPREGPGAASRNFFRSTGCSPN